jgi:molybdenum cofactor cytidylyltransferase
MRITGVLLAAGRGSRFGGDKLRARLRDGTPIGVQAARNLASVLPQTVAVVRPDDRELAALLASVGVEVTECAQADRGMGASLAHAVRLHREAEGWLVALADMPLVRPATLRAIVQALQAGALIAAPRCRGRRGNPVGFAAPLGDRLAALDADIGAREILQAEADRIEWIDVDDPGVLTDIDTPAELEGLGAPKTDGQR